MSAPMRERITNGCVDLSYRVPVEKAEMVKRVMQALLEDGGQDDATGYVTPEEAFGPRSPARALRGYRYREALTQAQLAKLAGVTAQNISDMECGRRGIGKELAKKLGEALNAPWERFL